jgi:hypothetical protein
LMVTYSALAYVLVDTQESKLSFWVHHREAARALIRIVSKSIPGIPSKEVENCLSGVFFKKETEKLMKEWGENGRLKQENLKLCELLHRAVCLYVQYGPEPVKLYTKSELKSKTIRDSFDGYRWMLETEALLKACQTAEFGPFFPAHYLVADRMREEIIERSQILTEGWDGTSLPVLQRASIEDTRLKINEILARGRLRYQGLPQKKVVKFRPRARPVGPRWSTGW